MKSFEKSCKGELTKNDLRVILSYLKASLNSKKRRIERFEVGKQKFDSTSWKEVKRNQ